MFTLHIIFTNIPEKELFFGDEVSKKLTFLTDTLTPENHANLVNRLKDDGMRTGVTVLLYGAPGTGKTESVYQMARKTGRDIKMISISETKSIWFGESEKLIKRVFDEYRRKVEKCEIPPILLFNETDGIFSTRKKIGSSSVDQTENAIQNIILHLSDLFELSGGQIENIARKCILQQALYGTFPLFSEIQSFCNEEQMNRRVIHKIGFSYNLKEK